MTAARPGSIVSVMVILAMACGLAIASAYQGTAARIERNRAELLARAVLRVLPGAATQQGYELQDGALVPVEPEQAAFIAGFGQSGALVGVAVPARVMGYQDRISMLLGYAPLRQQLVGFAVLESRETPGLGAKIATDSAFLAGVAGLDVALDAERLRNPVTLTAAGAERLPWQIDGITGATISSRAVAEAVNESAALFARIRARAGELSP